MIWIKKVRTRAHAHTHFKFFNYSLFFRKWYFDFYMFCTQLYLTQSINLICVANQIYMNKIHKQHYFRFHSSYVLQFKNPKKNFKQIRTRQVLRCCSWIPNSYFSITYFRHNYFWSTFISKLLFLNSVQHIAWLIGADSDVNFLLSICYDMCFSLSLSL